MGNGSVLLVGVSTAVEVELRTSIPEASFEAYEDAPGAERFRGRVGPAVAVVSVERNADAAFRLVAALAASDTRIVVLGPTKDADLILRAMREGAHEFVLASDRQRLSSAVRDQIRPPQVGKVITVFPAKGGVGATSIAVNLAGCWQSGGARACVVDFNLSMGDVLGFLDLSGGYPISDVLGNLGRLDRGLLDSAILHHRSGIAVLTQCERLEEAERVQPRLMQPLLGFLRQNYDAVIVDGLRSFDDLALAVLDCSDRVLLTFTQEVPAVRDAHRCVGILRRLGHDDPKLKLLVNRYEKSRDITPDVIAETTGMRVSATIANDYQALSRAVHRGALLLDEAPRAEITRDIEALHQLLTEAARPSAPDRKSLLGRFFSLRTAHGTR